MRVTGTGHAGMRIDTPAGSILCDPWVNPAFFASWFPFPDNSQLDWERLGEVDYLYISHLHRDHFDAAHLRRFVSKSATVLLPDYPTSQLEDELRALGFTTFLRTRSNEPIALGDGLTIMIQALTSPNDGPIGDSSLWVEHNGIRLLNQNDARPANLSEFAKLGPVHAHLLQFSGAIWYPMTYDISAAARIQLGKQKRSRQFDRTIRYIDDLKGSWVFPIAGPPCFLDDELWSLNDLGDDEANIFMDQQVFIDQYRERGYDNGRILLPGSVAELTDDECTVRHPVSDVRCFFAHKTEHLRAYRDRQRPVIEAEKATWRHPEIDVFDELQRRIEPLLRESTFLAARVDGSVLLRLLGDDGESIEPLLIDFAARQVRRYANEDVRYQFTTKRTLVEHLLYTGEIDWVNSLLLSCRSSAKRQGPYNEAVFTFLKCLSTERLQYAEGWYAEQSPDADDIPLDGWVVQRRCPHLKADLSRFAVIDGNVLTCQMHGWQFDLDSGRCLTSADHAIRAQRAQ
ncbi:MAG: Rieske 2Fe-2S domain-containing protein [Acidimicrobiales bacterium]